MKEIRQPLFNNVSLKAYKVTTVKGIIFSVRVNDIKL